MGFYVTALMTMVCVGLKLLKLDASHAQATAKIVQSCAELLKNASKNASYKLS